MNLSAKERKSKAIILTALRMFSCCGKQTFRQNNNDWNLQREHLLKIHCPVPKYPDFQETI